MVAFDLVVVVGGGGSCSVSDAELEVFGRAGVGGCQELRSGRRGLDTDFRVERDMSHLFMSRGGW